MKIELTDEEAKMIYNLLNSVQSHAIDKNMQQIIWFKDSEKHKDMISQWHDETVTEWMLLQGIKKKLKSFA